MDEILNLIESVSEGFIPTFPNEITLLLSYTVLKKFNFANISEAICHFSAFGALIYYIF